VDDWNFTNHETFYNKGNFGVSSHMYIYIKNIYHL